MGSISVLVWRDSDVNHTHTTRTHSAPTNYKAHPIPLASHSNSGSSSNSKTRMKHPTAARMRIPSSTVRIGAGMLHGQRRGELGTGWCWVRGREARQDGQLQRPRDTKAIEPAGIVLTRRALLLLIAAACVVAPTASAHAFGWPGRRFPDRAHV